MKEVLTLALKERRYSFPVACVLFLLLSAMPQFTTIALVIFTICLLIENRRRQTLGQRKWPTLFMIAYFVMLCIGLLWTQNLEEGTLLIGRRIAFLFVPVIFLFIPTYSKKECNVLMAFFIIGAIIKIFLSFGQAFDCWGEHHWAECFYSLLLSHELHPSYQALFDVVIVAYLFDLLIADRKSLSRGMLILAWTGVVIFPLFMILLASKGGFLSLILLFFLAAMYFARIHKKLLVALIAFVVITGGAIALVAYSPYATSRFNSMFHAYTLPEEELFATYRTTTESTPARLMIWTVARHAIARSPMGYGTGDAEDVLMSGYNQRGMTGAMAQRLNAHNQYFQTTLAIGIPGLILLLGMCIAPLVYGIRKRDFLLISMQLIFMVNMLVEAMFEKHAGIMFFCIFTCFLMMRAERLQKEKTSDNTVTT